MRASLVLGLTRHSFSPARLTAGRAALLRRPALSQQAQQLELALDPAQLAALQAQMDPAQFAAYQQHLAAQHALLGAEVQQYQQASVGPGERACVRVCVGRWVHVGQVSLCGGTWVG